jgi:hypothetical protein
MPRSRVNGATKKKAAKPGRHQTEGRVAGLVDHDLTDDRTDAVARHAGDAEHGDAFCPSLRGDQVGDVGEVRREERAPDDGVEDRGTEQERPDAVDQDERQPGDRVEGAAGDEHAAASDRIEQPADERSRRHARRRATAEDQPDGELRAADVPHEQRQQHHHGEADGARQVDEEREPERPGVERRHDAVAQRGSAAGSGARRRSRYMRRAPGRYPARAS